MATDLDGRWQVYLDFEKSGTRDVALRQLAEFIKELLGAPAGKRDAFSGDLCARVVDKNEKLPMRQPLFDQVIFPFLKDGILSERPNAARWLAGMSQLYYRSKDHFPDDAIPGTERLLLEKAVNQNPNDHLAARRLIEVLARWFNYAIHEVPSGVLCGPHSASSEDCDEYLRQLNRFKELCEAQQMAEPYRQAMSQWHRHFVGYQDYLIQRPRYKRYAEYLKDKGAL